MPAETKKKLRPEMILLIIALCAGLLALIMALICIPYYGKSEDPQQVLGGQMQHIPETQPPVPETTGPTEPPPELNPYGRLDFQYDGRYMSCLRTDTIPGVDVSAYQGEIDWEKVAASGIGFAIIRLGYRGYGTGKLVEDDYWQDNVEGALNAGLDVGVYFFSQAVTAQEAVEEARFVMERIKQYDITMPLVFDWEYVNDEARTAGMDKRTLTDCYLAFCQEVAAAGYTPMSYFNWYQSTNLMHLTELEEYPFWLALYAERMTYPYRVEMWQYTCTGKVPGIAGDVDINVYFPNG